MYHLLLRSLLVQFNIFIRKFYLGELGAGNGEEKAIIVAVGTHLLSGPAQDCSAVHGLDRRRVG